MKRDTVTPRDMSLSVTRPFQRDGRDNTLRGVTSVTVGQHGEEVGSIAHRLARLTVHHRDPERFFIERSELVHELRTLARKMGRA